MEEKAKGDGAVSVVKNKYDVYETVKHAVGLISGFEKFNENTGILIKPSIAFPAYPYQAATTSPEIIKAVIELLLENGIKKDSIVLGERSIKNEEFEISVLKSGINKVCDNYGIKILDISKSEFEEIEFEGCKFKIFRECHRRKRAY